jgi:hypothetical protein
MPVRDDTPASDYAEIDRFDGGVGWLAHPDEKMQRASHAFATDAGVFLIDPLDAPGIDDLVAEFGNVAGVVVLLDRHGRDAGELARRHDVPVYLPQDVDANIDAPTERLDGRLPGTDYELRRVTDFPGWHEAALWDGETLVVPEAVGTADYFRAGSEALGVHPMLRVTPPRSLGNLSPERVLVGHGAGVSEDAAGALRSCLRNSRRRAPKAYLGALKSFL